MDTRTRGVPMDLNKGLAYLTSPVFQLFNVGCSLFLSFDQETIVFIFSTNT